MPPQTYLHQLAPCTSLRVVEQRTRLLRRDRLAMHRAGPAQYAAIPRASLQPVFTGIVLSAWHVPCLPNPRQL
jgi:hypothetical protein